MAHSTTHQMNRELLLCLVDNAAGPMVDRFPAIKGANVSPQAHQWYRNRSRSPLVDVSFTSLQKRSA
jgi:hypothetical protein